MMARHNASKLTIEPQSQEVNGEAKRHLNIKAF